LNFVANPALQGKGKLKVPPRERSVIRLPAYEQVKSDPILYAHANRVLHLETNPGNARALVQAQGEGHTARDVWVTPPPIPLTTAEMDHVFDLPYARSPHPAYADEHGGHDGAGHHHHQPGQQAGVAAEMGEGRYRRPHQGPVETVDAVAPSHGLGNEGAGGEIGRHGAHHGEEGHPGRLEQQGQQQQQATHRVIDEDHLAQAAQGTIASGSTYLERSFAVGVSAQRVNEGLAFAGSPVSIVSIQLTQDANYTNFFIYISDFQLLVDSSGAVEIVR
jgi:hypothetical protein